MNLDGLASATHFRTVSISDNASLISLSGLVENTSRIFENLELIRLPQLSSLIDFTNLIEVGGSLIINENTTLTDLTGLENLGTLSGDLIIENNESLLDFCGLQPLMQSNGLKGGYTVQGNFYNPTFVDLIQGPCSQ